jgi:hypothetical protein
MGSSPSSVSYSDPALERRIADLTILYEVSRALQGTLDEDRAFYTILTGITHGRGLGFNRAFILLPDPGGEFLEGRQAIGPSSPGEAATIWRELRDKHLNFGEILVQGPPPDRQDFRVNSIVTRIRVSLSQIEHPLIRLMRSHDTCLVSNGSVQPEGWALDPSLTDLLGTETFAAAALYQSGRNLGLLLADNAITRAPIRIESLRMLQIYAQVASASLHNMQLYRELTSRIAVCENTNRALRDSQEQLLRAERLSTIGKMAALLAHEIRTPLVSIGGFARRLARKTPPEDGRREEIEIVVSEVTRLERLIEEVLGYTRIIKPYLEPVDVNELIRSVLAAMQDIINKGSVHAIADLLPGLPNTRADKSQIRQLLINLIANALDAMPTGGLLTIRTRLDGDYLELGILDTGVGIAREHWGKLFTPFYTTKPAGTGLGLAVVSQVIENHKGSFRLESEPGQGSAFYIRLALDPTRINLKPESPEVVPI